MKRSCCFATVALCLVATSALAARAPKRPAPPPKPAPADPQQVAIAKSVNAFAFDLYGKLADAKGNLFFSPQSISTALTMTWAGARGETAEQMAKVLRLPSEGLDIHAAEAKLLASLSGSREKQGYELAVANALWGQKGHPWLPDFLATLKTSYGAGLEEVDFAGNAEAVRKTINQWVEKQTRDKIKDLVPPGVLTPLTRLVLTNAIYFKGDWANQFKKEQTKDEDFFAVEGTVKAPLMRQAAQFGYLDGGNFQALEMPYKGDALAMVVLLPKAKDGLAAFEKDLTAEKVAEWLRKQRKQKVVVMLPKFKTTAQFMLKDVLSTLGMSLPFDPQKADFSGMDGKKDLFISHVIHKAFVDVNEEGTEAAAATAVIVATRAMHAAPPVFRADHPFVFLIRDVRSGCILFLGRVQNPAK